MRIPLSHHRPDMLGSSKRPGPYGPLIRRIGTQSEKEIANRPLQLVDHGHPANGVSSHQFQLPLVLQALLESELGTIL